MPHSVIGAAGQAQVEQRLPLRVAYNRRRLDFDVDDSTAHHGAILRALDLEDTRSGEGTLDVE